MKRLTGKDKGRGRQEGGKRKKEMKEGKMEKGRRKRIENAKCVHEKTLFSQTLQYRSRHLISIGKVMYIFHRKNTPVFKFTSSLCFI